MTAVKVPDAVGETLNMLEIGDFIHPKMLSTPTEQKRIFENVPNFKFRDDDLMLCTFGKTGTHWVYEILMMILNRSPERVKTNKVVTMLECFGSEEVDKQPSPRVVNCHYPPRYLPLNGMKAKQVKTVLCVRNPKDTAVSYFNHMKGIKEYGYEGKWENWLPVYLQGKLEYEKYTTYLSEWHRLAQDGPGFPLHIIHFEDLKANGKEEMDKLLKFLGVELDEKLKMEILDMCGFEKMAEEKGRDFNKLFEDSVKKDFHFFRKGQVGDWKNWFTVAQNEMFDGIWNKETEDLSLFQFKYTQPKA